MNRRRSKLMYVFVISVIVIGTLAVTWPSVAQNEKPPLTSGMKQFLEERIHGSDWLNPPTVPHKPQELNMLSGQPTWNVELLSGSGSSASSALDSMGRPHIAYYDSNLMYAYFDGAIWHTTTVVATPNAGNGTSLALDKSEHPHISYCVKTSYWCDNLGYAYFDGSTWHTEMVDNGGTTSSIQVDAMGRPHIVYFNGGVKYAYKDETGWDIELIDATASGSGPSFVLDTQGRPHVVYDVVGSTLYAVRDETGWHSQVLPVAGAFTSLTLDSLDRPLISYCTNGSTLTLAMLNSGQWSTETIESGASYSSLKFDTSGQLHVAYFFDNANYTERTVKYATRTGSTWQIQTITSRDYRNPWSSISLAFDTHNLAHITYDANGMHHMAELPDLSLWTTIAFASYRNETDFEIFTARGDGSLQSRRTFDSHVDYQPKSNHGATQIAFASNRIGHYEIYAENADGTNLKRLTTTSANNYLPAWSFNNSRIAFYSYRDGNAEIYAMNPDGSDSTRLTNNSAWDGHPTWSPDGERIAFISDRSGAYEIWTMSADGSNQQQLTHGLNFAAYPDWSPDGSHIAFNDDFNNDGWFDIGIINADGSGLVHPLGNSPTNFDFMAPAWAPNGSDLAFSSIQWTYYQGNYYWVTANIQRLRGNGMSPLIDSGYDWWPDWQTTDTWPPSSQVNTMPSLVAAPQFTVGWSGADVGMAGIMSFDIQYRDGQNSTWTSWLTATSQISATFTGQYGHTYYFRSRARDYANNLEAYPNSPDAMTTIYQYAASGQILDNREQSVAVANVQTNPTAMNAGFSRYNGTYDLYFAADGVYTLTTVRSNFGQLPPLLNVTVPNSNSLPTLYLPPLNNQLSDSHFESGALSAWNASGDLIPTITSTAHTGNYAVLLGGSVPTDTLTTGPWHSAIAQTINVSSAIVSGTLSLLYRVESAKPLSDTLTAYVVGASNTLTFTLPMTATEWTHAWFELSTWIEPTATVKLDFTIADIGRTAEVVVDEMTWGSAIEGSRAIFMPLVRR